MSEVRHSETEFRWRPFSPCSSGKARGASFMQTKDCHNRKMFGGVYAIRSGGVAGQTRFERSLLIGHVPAFYKLLDRPPMLPQTANVNARYDTRGYISGASRGVRSHK